MIDHAITNIVVVIPVLNEEKSLKELFYALEQQTLSPYKVIFIDAGSKDNSVTMVSNWASFCSKNNNIKVLQLFNPGGTPGENRNLGIINADSEWIAFLDAGITPVTYWLSSLTREIKGTGQKAIFGRCHFNSTSTFGRSVCAQSYGCTDMPVMPASLYHINAFEKIGFFKEGIRAAEDRLWMLAFDRYYGKRLISKNILAIYNHFPTTLSAVVKKWWMYQKSTINSKVPDKKTWALPLLALIIICSFFISYKFGFILVGCYLILRGVYEPIRRSKRIFWWTGTPCALIWAPIIGVCIDVTLICASLKHVYLNIKKYLFNNFNKK